MDWQFLGTQSIFLDFGLIAYLSMSPEETDKYFDRMASAFYDRCLVYFFSLHILIQMFSLSFSEICTATGVPAPWTREEFGCLCLSEGSFCTLWWCFLSADLQDKYPAFAARSQRVLRMCLKHCPELLGENDKSNT